MTTSAPRAQRNSWIVLGCGGLRRRIRRRGRATTLSLTSATHPRIAYEYGLPRRAVWSPPLGAPQIYFPASLADERNGIRTHTNSLSTILRQSASHDSPSSRTSSGIRTDVLQGAPGPARPTYIQSSGAIPSPPMPSYTPGSRSPSRSAPRRKLRVRLGAQPSGRERRPPESCRTSRSG